MTMTIYGLFDNRSNADNALDTLRDMGYSSDEISVVMQDKEGNTVTEGAAAGAVSGAATGTMIGGLAGLLIGIGAIAIPGVGAILIGGPLAAALGLTGAAATTATGAMTGALAGGLVGGLVKLGFPKEDAERFERRIKEGAILVMTHLHEGEEDEVRQVLQENNADQVKSMPVEF